MKKTYWFHAKKYGYGWGLPSNVYGWIVFIIFILWFTASLIYLNPRNQPVGCAISLIGSVLFLYSFLKAKGEPARWRWGDDEKSSNPNEKTSK